MGNSWFRIYEDFFENPKILSLSFENQRHFIGVLALKASGVIDQECSEIMMNKIVAQRLWIDHSAITDVKHALVQAGLIDSGWMPLEIGPMQGIRPPANVWKKLRAYIFERDDYTCQYCGAKGIKLECDHVMPVSLGGGHDHENLVAACVECNRKKRDKLPEEWWAICSQGGN